MTTEQIIVVIGLFIAILQAISAALNAYNANINREIKGHIIRAAKHDQAK
jgi:hypothetical protein